MTITLSAIAHKKIALKEIIINLKTTDTTNPSEKIVEFIEKHPEMLTSTAPLFLHSSEELPRSLIVDKSQIYILFNRKRDKDTLIDSGHYKKVYSALHYQTLEWVIFATAQNDPMGIAENEEHYLKELQKLPHMAQTFSALSYTGKNGVEKKGIIQKRYNLGNLYNFLQEHSKELDILDAHAIASQFLEGLSSLHEHHIIHRDLKPQNLLIHYEEITSKIEAVITDFGFAWSSLSTAKPVAHFSPMFVPPEIVSGCIKKDEETGAIIQDFSNYADVLSEKADIWGAGVILLHIYKKFLSANFFALYANTFKHCIVNIQEQFFSDLPTRPTYEFSIENLIWKMLQREPSLRVSAQRALDQLQNEIIPHFNDIPLQIAREINRLENPNTIAFLAGIKTIRAENYLDYLEKLAEQKITSTLSQTLQPHTKILQGRPILSFSSQEEQPAEHSLICAQKRLYYSIDLSTNDLLAKIVYQPGNYAAGKKEISILQELSESEGVVQLLAYEETPNSLTLFEKFYNFGDLGSQFSLRNPNEMVLQMLKGLVSVHKKNILHADIKPENIFLNKEFEKTSTYIGDFGSSLHMDTPIQEMHNLTEEYMAPEIFLLLKQDRPLGPFITLKYDIWSMGKTLFFLFSHFSKQFLSEDFEKSMRAYFSSILAATSIEQISFSSKPETPLELLLWEMVHIEPSFRPTAQEALEKFQKIFN